MKSSLTSNLCIGLTSNNLFNLINLERGGSPLRNILIIQLIDSHCYELIWQPNALFLVDKEQRYDVEIRSLSTSNYDTHVWHVIHENSFVVKSGPWIWKYSKGGGNPIFKPNIGPVGWYWPEKGRHTSQRKSSPARIEKKILAYNIERIFEFLSMAPTTL